MAINQSVADTFFISVIVVVLSSLSSFECSTNFQINANNMERSGEKKLQIKVAGVRFSFLSCFIRKYFCFSTSFSYQFLLCLSHYTMTTTKMRKKRNVQRASSLQHRTQTRWITTKLNSIDNK